MNFTEFGFDQKLLEGIEAINYQIATPIQEQVIPLILQGKDLIASAQTGTGKTAAFLLPIINKIISAPQHELISALVIVPTRELAIQIAQIMEGLSYFTPISSIAVYGGGDGASFSIEQKALNTGADVVICTPGRMLSHISMGYCKMAGVKYLILDEADKMLDMGFFDDIMRIISFLPKQRQNLLFSATMPQKMRDLARKILHKPAEVCLSLSKPPEKIIQEAFIVYDDQKIHLVKHILSNGSFKSVLIFCSKKENVKKLTQVMKRARFNIGEIHSDLDQQKREETLRNFKSKSLGILVATDILSRGIDVEDIELVINYDVPNDAEDYIHRIGRTARAETDGIAYTFVNELEQNKFLSIEKLLGHPVNKAVVPHEFGVAPLYLPEKKRLRNKDYRGKKKINSK